MLTALLVAASVTWQNPLQAVPNSAPQAAPQAREIPLDSGWTFRGETTPLGTYRGVPAFRMRNARAIRPDVELQDGTIDVDVAVTSHRSFVYLKFRMADGENHEEIYLRPHKSSLPDAVQYAPVFSGVSAWQLYHGPGGTAPTTFTRDEWMQVRLVLRGQRAALFIGDLQRPALVMPLVREARAGFLALRAFTPEGGAPDGEKVAAFRNVVVRPDHFAYDFGPEPERPPASAGLVMRWQLSPPFAANVGPVLALADSLLKGREQWDSAPLEQNGLLNIDRHVRRPSPRSAVIARLVLRSPAETLQRIRVGYSDFVTVFVNDRPLFSGDAHYSFDAPRQDGLVGLWQAMAWLPSRAGDNEVLFAVSDSFGGWALSAALDEPRGVTVVPPDR